MGKFPTKQTPNLKFRNYLPWLESKPFYRASNTINWLMIIFLSPQKETTMYKNAWNKHEDDFFSNSADTSGLTLASLDALEIMRAGGTKGHSVVNLPSISSSKAIANLPTISSKLTVADDKQTVVILDTGISSNINNLIYQYDFYSNDSNAKTTVTHGSIVANQVVSADSDANIIMLKVSADGSSSISMDAVDRALDWVAKYADQLNIASVNLSFGATETVSSATTTSLSDEFATLAKQDVAVVVAAGNSGVSTGVSALASDINAIAVSASDGLGNFASFSNRQINLTDIVADGVDVLYNGSLVSGTSFSAPVVAGAIAEIKDYAYSLYGREFTVTESLLLLQETADTMNGTGNSSYDELNLASALSALQDTTELSLIGINVG